MKVLNVGGGGRWLPPHFDGWEQTLLDIDKNVEPDICMDARELGGLPAGGYTAVFCSHNLEHYFLHDVESVLKGFYHVLNDEGFAEISVPNLANLFAELRAGNHDIQDVWYRTGNGSPITFHDVLYGWGAAMRQGNLYYAHRCGFTALSLRNALTAAGFGSVFIDDQGANIHARAYKKAGVACP